MDKNMYQTVVFEVALDVQSVKVSGTHSSKMEVC